MYAVDDVPWTAQLVISQPTCYIYIKITKLFLFHHVIYRCSTYEVLHAHCNTSSHDACGCWTWNCLMNMKLSHRRYNACLPRASLALTHWGRLTHICVNKLTIIGSDNGLSPGLLLIGPLGTNVSDILIGIQAFLLKKMHLKVSSAKWRPFCRGPNVLTPFIRFLNEIAFINFFLLFILNKMIDAQLDYFSTGDVKTTSVDSNSKLNVLTTIKENMLLFIWFLSVWRL